jgi:hypothetical protein
MKEGNTMFVPDRPLEAQPRCPTTSRFENDLIGCGSREISFPDSEGMFDCYNCGIFFTAEAAGFKPLSAFEEGAARAFTLLQEGNYHSENGEQVAQDAWDEKYPHKDNDRYEEFLSEFVAGFLSVQKHGATYLEIEAAFAKEEQALDMIRSSSTPVI